MYLSLHALMVVGLSLTMLSRAQAASSTSDGRISVAQMVELIEKSDSDTAARNAAVAYLAGVGETAGIMIAEAGACHTPLSLSSDAAIAAVSGIDRAKWIETPATPLLVSDMLSRAGCR